jgi:hypothetical protein
MEAIQKLKEEVSILKNDVSFLKSHFEDEILTKEDDKNIDLAISELSNGKTTSLDDLKKELGL